MAKQVEVYVCGREGGAVKKKERVGKFLCIDRNFPGSQLESEITTGEPWLVAV